MLRTLAVQNYRSLRRLVVPLTDLNVVTGPGQPTGEALIQIALLPNFAALNGTMSAAVFDHWTGSVAKVEIDVVPSQHVACTA